MIIKQYELKKNLKEEIDIYLLYGQNSELINEIIDRDIKKAFSNNIFIYNESEILSHISNFEAGLFNKSFFENDKLIIINQATDKILDIIKGILEKNDKDFKIVLKSSILEKKSKLRNFFEKSKDLIIVPFYEDNYQTLSSLAQIFLKKIKLKFQIKI